MRIYILAGHMFSTGGQGQILCQFVYAENGISCVVQAVL